MALTVTLIFLPLANSDTKNAETLRVVQRCESRRRDEIVVLGCRPAANRRRHARCAHAPHEMAATLRLAAVAESHHLLKIV